MCCTTVNATITAIIRRGSKDRPIASFISETPNLNPQIDDEKMMELTTFFFDLNIAMYCTMYNLINPRFYTFPMSTSHS
jgi:hypothetical protein